MTMRKIFLLLVGICVAATVFAQSEYPVLNKVYLDFKGPIEKETLFMKEINTTFVFAKDSLSVGWNPVFAPADPFSWDDPELQKWSQEVMEACLTDTTIQMLQEYEKEIVFTADVYFDTTGHIFFVRLMIDNDIYENLSGVQVDAVLKKLRAANVPNISRFRFVGNPRNAEEKSDRKYPSNVFVHKVMPGTIGHWVFNFGEWVREHF